MPQGTPTQTLVARLVAAGVMGGSLASSFDSLADQLPENSSVRKFLHQIRDACARSPTLSAVRVLSASLVILWSQSVKLHNVSIVDIFWSLSFVLQALTYANHKEADKNGFSGRRMLVNSLTMAWGTRLASYLYWRNHISAHGVGAGGSLEDFRYQAFRRAYDKKGLPYWWFSLIQVFALQGALSLTVGAPLRAACTYPQPQHFTGFDLVGTALWCVGYYFEAIGDMELSAFKANPANQGKMITSGLWGHTRHPNYFGNSCMWWGIYIIACAAQGGWQSLYGPALMTYLLTDVSGSALLEKTLKKTKPGFAEYAQSVPEFVPWKLLGF